MSGLPSWEPAADDEEATDVPELPEVRAHAARLTDTLAGDRLARFEPLTFTALKTLAPPSAEVAQVPFGPVTTRGKHLLVAVGDWTFVVHLMQGGRLKPTSSTTKKPRGGIARWHLTGGGALVLTEPGTERKAGVWAVTGDPLTQAPLVDLGPEADSLDAAAFAELAHANPMRLHGFLRNQSILAGLGRRLANEVCHRARLSPFTATRSLSDEAAAAVVDALAQILAEDADWEGTQSEMRPVAERPSRVHGRVGERCVTCETDDVAEVAYRAYTIAYCPTCQTGGQALADNTTSKFLK